MSYFKPSFSLVFACSIIALSIYAYSGGTGGGMRSSARPSLAGGGVNAQEASKRSSLSDASSFKDNFSGEKFERSPEERYSGIGVYGEDVSISADGKLEGESSRVESLDPTYGEGFDLHSPQNGYVTEYAEDGFSREGSTGGTGFNTSSSQGGFGSVTSGGNVSLSKSEGTSTQALYGSPGSGASVSNPYSNGSFTVNLETGLSITNPDSETLRFNPENNRNYVDPYSNGVQIYGADGKNVDIHPGDGFYSWDSNGTQAGENIRAQASPGYGLNIARPQGGYMGVDQGYVTNVGIPNTRSAYIETPYGGSVAGSFGRGVPYTNFNGYTIDAGFGRGVNYYDSYGNYIGNLSVEVTVNSAGALVYVPIYTDSAGNISY